uniref:SPK domain-containing protein n=1 Tax=Panagrolaimus sp. ES5 TaxID=591445 RepID=A0AC34GWN0_9BILA
MAEPSERECKKIFAKLIQSLQEYTKEDITDPEAIKSEIIELLKTHRPIKLADFKYGLSRRLKKDNRLIIKEKEDKTKCRLFSKYGTYWFCSKYSSLREPCRLLTLKFKYGILFAPIHHVVKCEARDYSTAMDIQNLLMQGKTKEARMLEQNNRISLHDSRASSSILNASTLSSTTEMENESILEQSINENTSTSIDSNSTSSTQQQLSSPVEPPAEAPAGRASVKREFSDPDYCIVIDEPAAKRTKTEAITKTVETYSFDHPSASILKQICEKLKIKYDHEAYIFWGRIMFNKFAALTDNIQTHEFKSSNFFACLSLFFTGKIRKCHLIEDTVKSAFCIMSDSEADQIFSNSTVTDEQIEFFAKFLSCRIGIYQGQELKKYGNWETENNDLPLILSFIDEMYSVVLDV